LTDESGLQTLTIMQTGYIQTHKPNSLLYLDC